MVEGLQILSSFESKIDTYIPKDLILSNNISNKCFSLHYTYLHLHRVFLQHHVQKGYFFNYFELVDMGQSGEHTLGFLECN